MCRCISEGKYCRPENNNYSQSICMSWPLSVKHAAKIAFAQYKCRTFQSIIYPADKNNFIGISSILAWGKSRVGLPPPFIAWSSEGCKNASDSDKDALDLKIITILGSFGQKLILGRNNNRNPMWDYIYQININPNRLRYVQSSVMDYNNLLLDLILGLILIWLILILHKINSNPNWSRHGSNLSNGL